ncbi:MAG: dTMP kinase [Candidatus Bathyarchaeia archaeon]
MSIIALEGIDKSGKKTQAKLLAKRLIETGRAVQCISFPDYQTPLGQQIKSFLEGGATFRPEVRQLLYVANRWEREADLKKWLHDGVCVIADRYIPAGLAYGLANGLDLGWMLKLEEGLPKPTMVIVLDLPPQVAAQRDGSKDLYERDFQFQRKVRESYLQLSRIFQWEIVDAAQPIPKVAEEVWRLVSRLLSHLIP